MSFELDKWIVCWTPANFKPMQLNDKPSERQPGAILVDRLGSDSYNDPKYLFKGGACYLAQRRARLKTQIMMMFIDFHTCVVRDGIDPQAAHREFLKIGEYRRRISRDIEGAED